MSDELVVRQSDAIAPQQAPIEFKDEFNAIIFMAAKDPTVDVGKMQALLDMKRQVKADNARVAFMEAFNAAQSEMRPIVKDSENKHTGSKYALMETIDKGIRPVYTAHGFTLTFDPQECPKENHVRLKCTLFHKAGHEKVYGPLDLHVDDVGAKGNATKTPIHGQGSGFTYARRYMKLLVFDLTLTEEDNDGNRRLSDEQYGTITDLVEACGLSERALGSILAIAGAKTIDDIKPQSYDGIVQALRDKLALKQREAK